MNKLTYKAILKKYNPGTNKAGREVRSITFLLKILKKHGIKLLMNLKKKEKVMIPLRLSIYSIVFSLLLCYYDWWFKLFSYSLLFYPGLKHPGIFFNIQLDRFGKKRWYQMKTQMSFNIYIDQINDFTKIVPETLRAHTICKF